ncbi:hypothetical protein I9018_12370 [Pseudomonas sp. MPFS]|uniref:hypothetical protein n=1 Tax=Pseudomonas sp. MPFS TaxID=2795724 RepID=UPI001F13CCCC|nr:hypothetical protein [Pseudomonas sp. MPFS]UMZ14432.1 hypothetical protein I9018_12370 [Pseudomonas sp. MPFS]
MSPSWWWWAFWLFTPLIQADAASGISFTPQQCSTFQWSNLPGVSERAAVIVPVTMEGRTYYFQLDTGSYLTYLKGDLAQQNGWLNDSDHSVSLPQMTFAGAVLPPGKAANLPSQKSRRGTLGLSSLMGRRLVIDYPLQRVCLIEPGQWNPENDQYFEWIPAALVKGGLSIPVTLGDETLSSVLVDSGSSMFSLLIRSPEWKKYTGIEDEAGAPLKVVGGAWGHKIEVLGAAAEVSLKFGSITIQKPDVYTVRPLAEEARTFGAGVFQGVLGNALFWDRVVVMKLDGPDFALGVSKLGK